MGGVAFGLALWAKPPVFALTLVTAALAAGGAWLADALFDPSRDVRRAAGSAWRTGAAVGLPCALVAAPYYALDGGEVVRYFLHNSFDESTAFWKVPGGWTGAVRYYLLGEGGELLMGRGFYAWVVLYALTLGWLAWRRQARELALQALLLSLTLVSLGAILYGTPPESVLRDDLGDAAGGGLPARVGVSCSRRSRPPVGGVSWRRPCSSGWPRRT